MKTVPGTDSANRSFGSRRQMETVPGTVFGTCIELRIGEAGGARRTGSKRETRGFRRSTAGQASSGTPRRGGASPWVLTHGHGTSTTSKPHRGDIYLWGGRETCSVG